MAGRPTKEPGQKMDVPLRVMLTPEQDELIRQAAGAAGMDLSAWVRSIILEAARRHMPDMPKTKRKKGGE